MGGHRCVTSFSAGRRLHRAADRGRRGAARDADAAAAGGAAGGLRDAAWTGDARRGGRLGLGVGDGWGFGDVSVGSKKTHSNFIGKI